VTCAAGILCGVGAALALGRGLAGVLLGVAAREPRTVLAAVIAFPAAATVACRLPARRATRISPSLTLREG
jgi:putative ABC transport system permease protein